MSDDDAMTVMRRPLWTDPRELLPWVCVVSVVAWLGALAMRFPAGDGDLLWQRWLGDRILREHAIPRALGDETFAASGAPWTPHEWLFSAALAAGAHHGATWLVPLVCALAVGVALATVVLRCRRRRLSSTLTSAAVLVCALATIQSFGARAQVLGWAGVAMVVWLLESEGPLAWAAVPVTVMWANLHASAFLAPAVAALFAFAAVLRDRAWSRAVRRALALAVACGAATLATPLGFDLTRYALALLASPIRHSISEWGATSASSYAFVAGALPLLLLLAAFGVRASLRDRLLAAAFTVLLFAAVRNVPVFALVAAPIALAALPRSRAHEHTSITMAVRGAASAGRRETFAGWVTLAAVACCGALITTLSWQRVPSAESTLPLGTARALMAQAHLPPRVFCEDFAWCSLFLNEPARFFMDGRCDPYPAPVWRDYREVIDGNRRWSAILDRERIDAVLVRRNGALDSLLAERRSTWRRIAADAVSGLYVRPAVVASASAHAR
ncbi:MAG: hypothetical protein JWM87_4877 [Candidatus Eremiobacteraeota bacterium]|nr:hypothetical protein [Candidatus Eremiobacteraeota bacterium]